ncbi:BspA family leucine-rich repeat surface protein [Ekhidna sp.]|uniref:BspA family leucine-rich repeat surface protein n=1 Tax=Ekhidna sp. TaxID=2608089 RepID=UPI003CCBCDDC
MKQLLSIVLVLAVSLCFGQPELSRQGDYSGGSRSSSDSYQLNSIFGQPTSGLATSASFSMRSANVNTSTSTLPDGLVAYYPFSGDATDASGNGNDGTVNGATLTTDRFGNADEAYSFDGVDDNIDIGNGVKPDFPFTVNTWVNVAELGSNQTLIRTDTWDGTSTYHGVLVYIGGDGGLVIEYGNGAASASTRGGIITDTKLTANQWEHIAIVFESASDIRAYFNGVLSTSVATNGTGTSLDYTSANGNIGSRMQGGVDTNFYNGVIDDIRIYNRALPKSEIIDIYSENNWLQSSSASFITTWQTTADNETITIPTFSGETYDYTVDWGDGTVETDFTGDASHTYATSATYTVAISGTFPRIYFNNTGDKDKIQTIEQWGNIAWTSMSAAFAGCGNLTYTATDVPDLSNVSSMASMFSGATSFNGGISSWDVSNVTDMGGMFFGAFTFNQNIGNWNVSAVTNMSSMFNGASSFNQDVSPWEVGQVTNMAGMFSGTAFNQDISDWDVSSVRDMSLMFQSASSFDQDLGTWDISGVVADGGATSFSMSQMLDGTGMSTDNYDATLLGWADDNGGTETIPSGVTLGANGLNYCGGEAARDELINTHGWTINGDSKECTLNDGLVAYYPFSGDATDASGGGKDGTLGDGSTTSTFPALTSDRFEDADAAYSFDGADDYILAPAQQFDEVNDPFTIITWVNWDGDASSQSQIVSWWDAGSAGGAFMYLGIRETSGNIMVGDTWGDSGVPLPANEWAQVVASFDGSSANLYLNGELVATETGRSYDLSVGNLYVGRQGTVNDEYFGGSIDDIRVYNRVLDETEITELYIENNWLQESPNAFITTWQTTTDNESINVPIGLDGETYDYTVDWGDGTVESGFTADANHTYATAGTYSVAITGIYPRIYFNNGDDGQMIDKIQTVEQWSNISWSSMELAFAGCSNLNVNATDAPDLSNVSSMASMFRGATSFNGDISNWDVSSVTDMNSMFFGGVVFNQDISSWDVGAVTNMSNMFNGASSFDQDLSLWEVGQVTNMAGMFSGTAFNQNISDWDISSVRDMSLMFQSAASFNQNLGAWNISGVVADGGATSFSMSQMFDNSGMSKANYDRTLIGWADDNGGTETIPAGISLGASGLQYCLAVPARDELINTNGWTISGDSENCGSPVLDLPFDGDDLDASGYGFDPSINGPVTTTDRSGNGDQAYSFDGVDDYMEIPNADFFGGSENVTMAWWQNIDNSTSFGDVLSFGNIRAYVNEGSLIVNTFINSTGESISTSISDGSWEHIVFTYDGVEVRIYKNGIVSDSQPRTGKIDNYIGSAFIGSLVNTNNYLDGSVDQIKVYRRIFSDLEVQDLFDAEKPFSTEALITSFSIPNQVGETTIDNDLGTIEVVMPVGTDVTGLTPTIEVSTGAAVSPESEIAQDFSNSVTYTVTAEDGITTKSYEVLVTTINQGLIAYYPFNGATNDQSGNGYNMSPQGNPKLAVDRYGVTSMSYELDGSDDRFESFAFDMPDFWTVSLWLEPFIDGRNLVSQHDNADPTTNAFQFNLDGDLDLNITTEGELGSFASATTDGDLIVLNQWQQAAVSYDGSTIRLYVNGELINETLGSRDYRDISSLNIPVTIGALSDGSGAFAGRIDEVRIYDEAISNAQVNAIYLSEFPTVQLGTNIASYSFPEQTGPATIGDGTILIEVENGTDLTNLVASFSLSANATATVEGVSQESGVTANDFTNPIIYKVTAEDGITTLEWEVTVFEASDTDTEILDFSFAEQTGPATIDDGSVDIEVANGTDLTSLVASFTLSTGATATIGGTAQQSGVTANDFSNTVTYTITAADNVTTEEWVVKVTEASNAATEFLAFSFNEQTGTATIGNGTVIIEVENGSDLTNLVPSFTLSAGATATVGGVTQVSGVTSNDFTNPVTYTVTAADNVTTQEWVVTVFEASPTATEILAYSFDEEKGPASIGNGTVNIEVAFGTDVSDLVATFDLSTGASATVGGITQESGVTSNDFTSAVTYTVTAADNVTTQDWIVNVSVASNDSTDIKSFVADGIEGEINTINHTVNLSMPSGTDLSALTPTIEVSTNATIAPASGVAQDFTSPVTYTVTAENTATQEWVVTASVESIPPENLFLSNSTITAGPSGKIVGDIGIIDEDNVIGDYTLSVSDGSENFEITAGRLVTTVELTSGDYSVTILAEGPGTIQETFVVTVEDLSVIQNVLLAILNSAYGKDVSKYRIIGVPVDSESIGTVFTSPAASELGDTWRMLSYPGGDDGRASDLSQSSTLQAGRGYWYITTVEPTIVIPDGSAPALNRNGEFELQLVAGWNLVGNPFNESWSWTEVITYNIDNGYIQSGDVSTDFFVYDPQQQTGYRNNSNIGVFGGGWARVNGGNAVTLRIPSPALLAQGRVATEGRSNGYVNSSLDWEVIVSVVGEKFYSALSGVSFKEEATSGFDVIDRQAPPAVHESVKVDLLDAELGLAINRVPYADNHTWNFRLETMDRTSTLRWDKNIVNELAEPLYIILPEEGILQDMRSVGEVTVTNSTSKVQIHYGIDPPLTNMINILATYPNPTDDEVFIRVLAHESLTNKTAQIYLYDHQGKRVKYLDGLAIAGNGSEFKLSLKDLSSGIYVLQVLIDDQKSKNIKIQRR